MSCVESLYPTSDAAEALVRAVTAKVKIGDADVCLVSPFVVRDLAALEGFQQFLVGQRCGHSVRHGDFEPADGNAAIFSGHCTTRPVASRSRMSAYRSDFSFVQRLPIDSPSTTATNGWFL